MLKIHVRDYTCTDANGHFKACEGIKLIKVIFKRKSTIIL